jgi:hypothetical protein
MRMIQFLVLFFISYPYISLADKNIHESLIKVNAGEKGLRFSAYADGYFAYDFDNPIDAHEDHELTDGLGGRDYTSNPLHDRQFSLGYGFFQIEFDHKNIGLRLAHHFGDIVQNMYFEEPERLKNIREASINIRLNDELLLEVGYLPSIFGFETFINKDNLHASRAYMTDFAPSFDSGVRLYWKKSVREMIKFQVTNGWQVLRDTNKSEALGFAYVYYHPKHFHFNWGQFFGDEAPSGTKSSYRYYNNLFSKIYLTEKWILAPMLDVGWEHRNHSDKAQKSWVPWQSCGASLRYAITLKHGLAGRFDRTYDPNIIIPELKTNTKHGWISNGYT